MKVKDLLGTMYGKDHIGRIVFSVVEEDPNNSGPEVVKEVLSVSGYNKYIAPIIDEMEVSEWTISKYGPINYASGDILNKPILTIILDGWETAIKPEIEKTVSLVEINDLPSQMPNDHDKDDIRNLKLSKKTFNALHRIGVQSIGQLRECTVDDLLSVKNIGLKAVDDIRSELKAYGLHLKEE